MAVSSIITGSIGLIFVNIIGAYNSFNPLIQLPWTTPPAVTAFLTTGFLAALGVCCAIFASVLLYLPFFKMADKQALKEEQESKAENQ